MTPNCRAVAGISCIRPERTFRRSRQRVERRLHLHHRAHEVGADAVLAGVLDDQVFVGPAALRGDVARRADGLAARYSGTIERHPERWAGGDRTGPACRWRHARSRSVQTRAPRARSTGRVNAASRVHTPTDMSPHVVSAGCAEASRAGRAGKTGRGKAGSPERLMACGPLEAGP